MRDRSCKVARMPGLQNHIASLAQTFAVNIVAALRAASIAEILSVTGGSRSNRVVPPRRGATVGAVQALAKLGAGRPKAEKTSTGRLARRSAEDIEAMAQRIATLLRGASRGMRAEQIRAALGDVDRKELPRPLSAGIAGGLLRTEGQKRATTYFLAGGRRRKR